MSAPTESHRSNESLNWRAMVSLAALLIVCAGAVFLFFVPVVTVGPSKNPAHITATEIEQLTISIELFKSRNKVTYLPSQFKLCELFGQYTLVENGAAQDEPLDRESVDFLTELWPQILLVDRSKGFVIWKKDGIDWNGNGNTDDAPVILEGDQCLVFFLGGIPDKGPPPSTRGFSRNPFDPALVAQREGRLSPLFEFPDDRLFIRATTPPGNAGFYSFADYYRTGQPYAYFSSYGVRNGYNSPIKRKYANGDCDGLKLQPYYKSAAPVEFLHPSGFQIISAGADGIFGPGGLWNPATTPAAGCDDQANFHSGLLGKTP